MLNYMSESVRPIISGHELRRLTASPTSIAGEGGGGRGIGGAVEDFPGLPLSTLASTHGISLFLVGDLC